MVWIKTLTMGKNVVRNAWPIHDFVHGGKNGKEKDKEKKGNREAHRNEEGSPLIS